MDTRKSLGMVFRCISMDLGRTLTFNINFRPPPPSEGPPSRGPYMGRQPYYVLRSTS